MNRKVLRIDTRPWPSAVRVSSALLLQAVYCILCNQFWSGQTLGKRLFGIKVVSSTVTSANEADADRLPHTKVRPSLGYQWRVPLPCRKLEPETTLYNSVDRIIMWRWQVVVRALVLPILTNVHGSDCVLLPRRLRALLTAVAVLMACGLGGPKRLHLQDHVAKTRVCCAR